MSFKLAPTTFSTKANETLAAIDAYAAKDASIVNILPDIKDTLNFDALNGLKGGNLGDGLTFLAKTKLDGFRVDADALTKGLLSSNSGLVGALKSLPEALQAGVLKVEGLSKIVATVNGIKQTVERADLSTLTGVGKLIDGLSNSNFPISFLDKSGLTNITSNLIREATKLGLPGSFAAIAQGIEDKSILTGVVKKLLPTVVGSSNLSLLSDIANCSVGKQVTKLMPSFAQEFTNKFVLPRGTSRSQYGAMLQDIDTSLTKLDTTWKTANFGGSPVTSVKSFLNCSKDFTSLLKATTSFNHLPDSLGEPSTMDTSAINNEMTKAAMLAAAIRVTNSKPIPAKNPLNTDQEYIGLFGSIKNPNYIPPVGAQPSVPIPTSVREAIAQDFPLTPLFA